MATSPHTIDEDDNDIRLDRWFKRHYPGLPHSMLEKYLRKGLVRVDGRKAQSSDRVQRGQVLYYPDIVVEEPGLPKNKKPTIGEQEREAVLSWVLYKDADIVIINKPSGLAVQGGTHVTRSLDDLLEGLKFELNVKPKLVHRLDRDTSGVLILARHSKSAGWLAKAFAAKPTEKSTGKTIDKTYWALVNGVPTPETGVIDLPLLKTAKGEHSHETVGVDEEEGKYAITEYRTLEMVGRKFAWMELKPLTGRTHQLRVHMQAIGCPITGDGKYGGRKHHAGALDVSRGLHLHARRIVIHAKITGRLIDVSAPLPEHMRKSFKALGLNAPKK